jgi:hypothetical protein
MSSVHVHLHVSDLSASRAFHERFLGAPPVKVKPGYAKFLPAFEDVSVASAQTGCCVPVVKIGRRP